MRVQDRFYDHRYETLIAKTEFDMAEAVRNGYKVKPHRGVIFHLHIVG
jgi:hypothetical protein